MDPNPDVSAPPTSPSLIRWVLGFLLVGAAWGLTTPFMRRAAVTASSQPDDPSRAWLSDPGESWLKRKIWGVLYGVLDVLKRPGYAVPLVINLTGSVWFFLLIGQAGTWVLVVMRIEVENADMWICRIESYGSDHEFVGFPVYRSGRMVG